jgi:hypothetical protein
MTERDLLDALWRRLCRPVNGMTARYVLAEHVRHDPTTGVSIADAIAIDTWGSGHYALEGYEVKCTRADWRREIREYTDRRGRTTGGLAKSLPWRQHCRRWYILAPAGVVPRDELPHGWGLIEAHDAHHGLWLRCTVKAAHNTEPVPLGARQVAGLMRATAQTAIHHTRASTHVGSPEVLATSGGATT